MYNVPLTKRPVALLYVFSRKKKVQEQGNSGELIRSMQETRLYISTRGRANRVFDKLLSYFARPEEGLCARFTI